MKTHRINWKIVCTIEFFAVCLLLVFYAFAVNKLTGGAYLIKNYSRQIEALSKENRNLEVNFAETSFLGSVEQRAKDLSFEKTTSVKYVPILADAVLAKAK